MYLTSVYIQVIHCNNLITAANLHRFDFTHNSVRLEINVVKIEMKS